MLTALVLGPESLAEMERVKTWAESHPFSLQDMENRAANNGPVPGDLPEFTCVIPIGYKVVFTLEAVEQGFIRHISISIGSWDRVPHPQAVFMIMKQFGFVSRLADCRVWFEEGSWGKAVNLIEFVR